MLNEKRNFSFPQRHVEGFPAPLGTQHITDLDALKRRGHFLDLVFYCKDKLLHLQKRERTTAVLQG